MGEPNRFITLTVNPHNYNSPEERGRACVDAWRGFVREYRRLHPSRVIQYMAVLELTKRGEPHLHIVARADWIDQKELSKWMNAKTGAPIVDIRLVKGRAEVAQYVGKYISKRPIRLGNLKRYWKSMLYIDPAIAQKKKAAKAGRSVWLIEVDLMTFKAWVSGSRGWCFQPFEGCLEWPAYEFDPGPPGRSDYIRQMK